MIKLKRIYEKPDKNDGYRILVDRLWPRGVSKERASLDEWLKDIAPTTELRKWFGHDPKRWSIFQKKYKKELLLHKNTLQDIKKLSKKNNTVTLVYAAKDEDHNEAIVLKSMLEDAK
ncbi:DUF488 domain-containing protein [Candidatus Uhrbacteria bacterium]|nr:DUF488 domain-containing protein [Candidatus Uhrbacteria bacterium]